MTIEEWVDMLCAIKAGKEVLVPYQLHEGLGLVIDGLGDIYEAISFLNKVREAEPAEIK